MKIYKLPQLAEATDGAYCLVPEDLKTEGAYLLWGRLRPGETGRAVAPRVGFEEIILVIKGQLNARLGKTSFSVGAGEAFLSTGTFHFDNPNKEEAVYIAAGGRISPIVKEGTEKQKAEIKAEPKTGPKEDSVKAAKEPEEQGADTGDFEITMEDAPTEEGE